MITLFYAHLVPIEDTLSLLDRYQMTEVEKDQLIDIILSTYHHRVLDELMLRLPDQHHEKIVQRIAENPHDLSILIYLKELDVDIEQYITDVGHQTGAELKALLWKRP